MNSTGRSEASPVEAGAAPASPPSGSHDVGTAGGGGGGGIHIWPGPVCCHELLEVMPGSQSTAPRNQCESAEKATVQRWEWQR